MAEETLPAGPTQIIQQVKFACYELGKAFDKQTKKQVYALKSLNLSNKTDELKQIKGIFPKTCWMTWLLINHKKSFGCKMLLHQMS